jgi:uncharacterized protein YndB with AHSA1/START domain
MPATQIGKLAVRRSIEINAPPERVWQEFESPERFRLWYTPAGGVDMPCKRVEYEPRAGGVFETEGYHEWQGGEQAFHFTGRVVVFDPPRELTVEMIPPGETSAMLLTFLLTPAGEGRTLAEIIQHGFENFGAAAENLRNAYEGGWTTLQLECVKNLVETGTATG